MTLPFEDSASPPCAVWPSERAFLARVYLKLFGGLVLSAAVAWVIDSSPTLQDWLFVERIGGLTFTSVGVLVLVAPVFVLLLASIALKRPTALAAGIVYWIVAGLIGASLSILGVLYTSHVLVSAFAVVGGAFAGLSLWAARTPRDLTAMGVFFANGLLGLILALLVAAFFPASGLITLIDLAGVVVFSGLIAADTQRLKRLYRETAEPEALHAASTYGALTLYMSFVNLLQLVLGLSGARGRR